MNFTIICLGKLKEKYLRDAADEYIKRLSSAGKVSVIELTPEKLSDNPSQKEIENALEAEAKKISEKLPTGAFVYSMCIEGKQLSSRELSAQFEKIALGGTNNIAFIIGSSFGLAERIKALSSVKLSMSRMTFPHQLARIMLLEQIYRAVQIEKGTKYHK